MGIFITQMKFCRGLLWPRFSCSWLSAPSRCTLSAPRRRCQVAQSLNSVANLLRAKGDLTVAEPLYMRAFLTAQAVFGKGSAQTFTPLFNWAELLAAQGRHEAAEPLLRQCLDLPPMVRRPQGMPIPPHPHFFPHLLWASSPDVTDDCDLLLSLHRLRW